MKNLLIIISLATSTAASAQMHAGVSLGYTTKNRAVFEISTAAPISRKVVFHPVNFKFNLPVSSVGSVVVFEPRMGYRLKARLEGYIGAGYHFADQDGKRAPSGGFKPGMGLIYRLAKNFALSLQKSGGIYSLHIGAFK